MKGLNKIILLFCLLFFGQNGYAQNPFLKAMNVFNDLTDGIAKFFSSNNAVDDLINKQKAKAMAGELHSDVSSLILVKDSIVFALEHTSINETRYKQYIEDLKSKLGNLRATLAKYKALMVAAGVNSQKLDYELQSEFLQKSQTLQLARNAMSGNNSGQMKQELISYFRSCINILKNAQTTLANFKA